MVTASDDPARRLIVLVGAARSGTTLLRLMLDAHEDIGAPAEAGIPSLIEHLGRVWNTVTTTAPASEGTDSITAAPPRIREAIRAAVVAPMDEYCQREGKQIYCDKSLDSVHHLGAVRALFPDAKFVILVRHMMDTIASGIEASPWGFNAYGYLPYVHASPENFVAALANYWCAHVEKALTWERVHGESCHRLCYEELVADPEKALDDLFGFLDLAADQSVSRRALGRPDRANSGPGDYKVAHTTRIRTDAVGGGRRVPVEMIPEQLLERCNAALTELGYPALDGSWNREVHGGADAVDRRAAALLGEALADVELSSAGSAPQSFALVADDAPELRWTIDMQEGTVTPGDGHVDFALIGATADLQRLVCGEGNVGTMLRTGRIRYVSASNSTPHPSEAAVALEGVMRALGRVVLDE